VTLSDFSVCVCVSVFVRACARSELVTVRACVQLELETEPWGTVMSLTQRNKICNIKIAIKGSY
jgi:hypothetical protein